MYRVFQGSEPAGPGTGAVRGALGSPGEGAGAGGGGRHGGSGHP